MKIAEVIQLETLDRFMSGSKAPPVLYHSTNADWSVFDPNKTMHGNYGFHAGTKDQAHAVQSTGGTSNNVNAERPINGMNVMPVHLSVKNPLRMEDKGTWSPWDLVTRLEKEHGIIDPKPLPPNAIQLAGYDQYRHQIHDWEGKSEAFKKYMATVRPLAIQSADKYTTRDQFLDLENNLGKQYITDLLTNAGYDGIVYSNKYEGNREDSYIALHPTQIKSAVGNKGTYDPTNPSIIEMRRLPGPKVAGSGKDFRQNAGINHSSGKMPGKVAGSGKAMKVKPGFVG